MDISGNGLEHFNPDSLEAKTLLGVDTNNNGIRDDFEMKTLLSSLDENTKQRALDAGYLMGKLMYVGFHNVQLTSQEAYELMSALVSMRQCKSDVRKVDSNSQTWSSVSFYNTKDRLISKIKFQNVIYDYDGVKTGSYNDAIRDSCAKISEFRRKQRFSHIMN